MTMGERSRARDDEKKLPLNQRERLKKSVRNIIKMKQPAVYIVTNKRNGTLYTGVTSHLQKRIYEHKNSLIEGFTSKYGCKILVFYEIWPTLEGAIVREHKIKDISRAGKLQLIEEINPEWRDLYENIV